METNQLKGIYLHGYQGYVTEEKKAFLNQFGDVYAPNIEYDNNPTILFELYEKFKDQKLDFVSGTSLGGILIYHLALLLDVPCLLLNPAVTAMEQVKDFIPKEAFEIKPSKKIFVLVGMKDTIVDPEEQIKFFEEIKAETNLVNLKIDDELVHFVPFDVFEITFKEFREYIK